MMWDLWASVTEATESVRLRLSPETIRLLRVLKEDLCFASLDSALHGLARFAEAHRSELRAWTSRNGTDLLTDYGQKRIGVGVIGGEPLRFKVGD